MPTRPLIGLSTSQPGEGPSWGLNGTPRRYAEAVCLAGGTPILLPNLPEAAADYAARVDAVLLTGGGGRASPALWAGAETWPGRGGRGT